MPFCPGACREWERRSVAPWLPAAVRRRVWQRLAAAASLCGLQRGGLPRFEPDGRDRLELLDDDTRSRGVQSPRSQGRPARANRWSSRGQRSHRAAGIPGPPQGCPAASGRAAWAIPRNDQVNLHNAAGILVIAPPLAIRLSPPSAWRTPAARPAATASAWDNVSLWVLSKAGDAYGSFAEIDGRR